MARQPLRRIALLMDRLVGFNHDVLLGVREFANPQRAWMCHFADPRKEHIHMVRGWDPHGILAFLFDHATSELVESLGSPFVDVANWLTTHNVPRVSVDDRAVGRLGAEHLMDLGLERFAFVGRTSLGFSKCRQEGFQSELAKAGYDIHLYAPTSELVPVLQPWTMSGVNAELSAWLTGLPKPIGIFADNDERALMVSEGCYASGIDVPNQVAILGVDNDPYLGSLGYPALSSIATPAKRVGYEAARLLDRLMNGGKAPEAPILLPPIGVVTRRSTDMLAIADPYVAAAVRLIRERACEGVTVPDVIKHAPVGRRTLEKLFRQHLGRSPLEEIRRVRIALAQHLLATTDLPVEAIAERSGFGSASWLATSFTDNMGMTPREYRLSIQGTA